MRTLLLTGYDEWMAPIGNLTAPLMHAYANRFGIDFRCWTELSGKHPGYWEKVPQILDAFDDGYERVIWLDCDQLITNPTHWPITWSGGFHASMDWGQDATEDSHFSMCGFVVHEDARELFDHLESEKEDWVDKPFPEQEPMRRLYRGRAILSSPVALAEMTTHPRRAFNAVPIQVHETVVDPWQPGDWCAHITMVDVPRRVEIFHEIRKQCDGLSGQTPSRG